MRPTLDETKLGGAEFAAMRVCRDPPAHSPTISSPPSSIADLFSQSLVALAMEQAEAKCVTEGGSALKVNDLPPHALARIGRILSPGIRRAPIA